MREIPRAIPKKMLIDHHDIRPQTLNKLVIQRSAHPEIPQRREDDSVRRQISQHILRVVLDQEVATFVGLLIVRRSLCTDCDQSHQCDRNSLSCIGLDKLSYEPLN